MLQMNRKAIGLKSLGLVVLLATMSSFSAKWGGDSYRIYVNNKLVMEEFVYGKRAIKSIHLDQRSQNDQVSVYYSHCGKVGQGRQLVVRDGKDKVLKEWKFADVSSPEVPMTWKARDVVGLQKNGERLNLHYASKEMPKGMVLAQVVIGKDGATNP